jgi:beta-N-acetylhexosaminidase
MNARAFISGCATLRLSAEERAFFRDTRPWGLILFARNCAEPDQIRRLTAEFRDAVGRADAPVLIDQEGGRVQRLRPPHWTAWPPARTYRSLFLSDPRRGLDLVRGAARLIAEELSALGITVDCLPVADVPQPGAHDIIGDRAYGESPDEVAQMARAAAEGLLDGGVLPVVKHIPGHGRAAVDSHVGLPVVDADAGTLRRVDFAPFVALRDLPMAMTAHVIYTAFDPDSPATLSPIVVGEVIRKEIGFDGLLMTDDLSMGALDGTHRERTERSFAAGCDMALHCNGCLDEMVEVASAAPALDGQAAARAARALDSARTAAPVDVAAIHVELANLC